MLQALANRTPGTEKKRNPDMPRNKKKKNKKSKVPEQTSGTSQSSAAPLPVHRPPPPFVPARCRKHRFQQLSLRRGNVFIVFLGLKKIEMSSAPGHRGGRRDARAAILCVLRPTPSFVSGAGTSSLLKLRRIGRSRHLVVMLLVK